MSPPGDRGAAGGARDTVARAQSALTATGPAAGATSASGPLDPACQAFSDPARRAHMSAALERKLAIMCGLTKPAPASATTQTSPPSQRLQGLAARVARASTPGGDIPVSNPALDVGGTTQSETSLAVVGNVVCAAWNDSGEGSGANGFSGHGVSLDGGITFTDGGPFPNGPFDQNFGDPTLAYSVRDNTFYYAALSSSGLSLWRSTNNCQSFAYVGVIHSGFGDDKEMMAVDNSPTSPFFGRIHIGWTNFGGFGDLNVATHSDNGGSSWTFPVNMPGSGSTGQGMYPALAPNGDVYMATVNGIESVGSTQDQRIYKSTDGGNTFSAMPNIASRLQRSEDFNSSFSCGRQALTGFIRYLSSPQIAITPDPSASAGYVVHAVYSYDSDGSGPDHSNVFYRRSTDGAHSWSAETMLNDDGTISDQFFPSLGTGDAGTLTVSWYDRRLDPLSNLAFDRFLTYSTDGGTTWNPNVRISDVSSPVAQTLPNFDPNIAFCYHGDYDQVAVVGDVVHVLWADDRRITFTGPNPDVYYDQFSINTSLGRLTVGQSSVGCSGTVTVSLSDSDLAGNGSQAVAITGSSGDAETLSLAAISGKPGRFTGSIATAGAPVVAGDGVLQVQDGDTLTITYNDADDGHGQTVVTTAQVRVDCSPPVISNVTSTLIARDAVTIASQASEAVNMRVDYGTSCATLTQSKTSDGFSDAPSLSLFALAPGRTFRFAVTETDASGNSTRDDNGGVCYAFSTPDVLFQTDFEKDQAGFTFDNTSGNGNGLWHRGGACAALVLGHSPTHTLYYGRDDTCTYDQAGLSNSGIATSPVINLASETFASLEFNYYLGDEGGGGFDQAAVQVSVNGGPYQIVQSNFARLDDEDPDTRVRQGAEPAGRLSLVSNTARWQHATIDLSSLLPGEGAGTLQFQFTFNTFDFGFNRFAGFYVDDFTVIGVGATKSCTSDSDCDDGLFCDGVETCQSGTCAKGLPVVCASSDNVDCTEDLCDEATHACVSKPNDARCDDGSLCDGLEICDPVQGCRFGAPGCPDDGVACTFESCDESLKLCAHVPEDFACNDFQFCDGVETCDPKLGCKSSGNPCNDGIDCTIDQCNEFQGCTILPDNTKCDDGLFCTGQETCQPGVGCMTTGNPCQAPNVCNEQFRQCVATCFTAVNTAHETAGRATHTNKNFFALGSNDALGIGSATTSLQGSGGTWHRVASCPAAPTVTSLNAAVVGDTVNVSGTASDPNGDIRVVKLTITSAFSSTPPITVTAGGTTTFSLSISLVPGDYTVVAQAFDAAGLSSSVTAPVAFSILPFAAPKIDSIAVAISGVDVTISGAASDVNNDMTLVQITILQGPNVIAGVAATGTLSWQGKISTLLPGAYSARAQAFDATGRVSGFSALIPFTIIDRCVVDTNAHHLTAGRATFTSKNGYRALGSNDALGKNADTLTALQGSAGLWKRLVSCPVANVAIATSADATPMSLGPISAL